MTLAESHVRPGRREQQIKHRRLTDTHVALLLLAPAMTLLFTVILYPLLNSMYIGLLDKSLITGGDEFVGLTRRDAHVRSDAWRRTRPPGAGAAHRRNWP